MISNIPSSSDPTKPIEFVKIIPAEGSDLMVIPKSLLNRILNKRNLLGFSQVEINSNTRYQVTSIQIRASQKNYKSLQKMIEEIGQHNQVEVQVYHQGWLCKQDG